MLELAPTFFRSLGVENWNLFLRFDKSGSYSPCFGGRLARNTWRPAFEEDALKGRDLASMPKRSESPRVGSLLLLVAAPLSMFVLCAQRTFCGVCEHLARGVHGMLCEQFPLRVWTTAPLHSSSTQNASYLYDAWKTPVNSQPISLGACRHSSPHGYNRWSWYFLSLSSPSSCTATRAPPRLRPHPAHDTYSQQLSAPKSSLALLACTPWQTSSSADFCAKRESQNQPCKLIKRGTAAKTQRLYFEVWETLSIVNPGFHRRN